MSTYTVGYFVGSLARASINRKLALAIAHLAPEDFTFEHVRIDDLPLYNQDDDGNQAPAVKRLKTEIAAADGLLFVTPEYNRSMPGVLKNAIDVGSRPSGKGVWNGKPGGVISVTQGPLGAFGANHALRQSLMAVDVAAMPFPEAYIGQVATLFDAEGKLINDKTRELLGKFVKAFATWIERNARSA